MTVKGIIQNINFNSNTCSVRLPYFENAGNTSEVVVNAVFSNTPGSYNGYKVGDVVFVEFENEDFDQAVVVGKLYLGAKEESADGRGAFNVSALTVNEAATIPITTKLSYPGNSETTVNVKNDLNAYKSIEDIARGLQKQETQIGSINAQLIDTGDSIGARVSKLEEDSSRHEAELIVHADEIDAKVSKEHNDGTQKGLGWNLNEESWRINAYDTASGESDLKNLNIVTIDRNGMTLNGDLKINGYPSEIVIKYARWAYYDNYPALYKDAGAKGSTDDYVGLYILKSGKYVLVAEYNKDKLGIITNETIAYEINAASWLDNEPNRAGGEYIWQWTRTFKYEWIDTGALATSYWVSSYEDKIVCITGATGEPGVSITKNKQWYILHSAGAAEPPKPIDDDTEPAEPATPSTPEEWMSTPPEAVNGHVVWTCYGSVFSDDAPEKRHIKYSAPVKDNAYALAQGKTTNYYSPTQPINNIKKGDCWFDTGYVKIATPATKTGYLGKFVVCQASTAGSVRVEAAGADRYISSASGSTYLVKITPDNIESGLFAAGTTAAYETGNLKQWDGDKWEDIAGELVTNKLTANYINALDITAKKITVKDGAGKTVFMADATSTTEGQNITLGSFKVDENSIKSGALGSENSVIVSTGSGGSANIAGSGSKSGWAFAAGNTFGVLNNGELYATAGKIGPLNITENELTYSDKFSINPNATYAGAYAGDTALIAQSASFVVQRFGQDTDGGTGYYWGLLDVEGILLMHGDLDGAHDSGLIPIKELNAIPTVVGAPDTIQWNGTTGLCNQYSNPKFICLTVQEVGNAWKEVDLTTYANGYAILHAWACLSGDNAQGRTGNVAVKWNQGARNAPIYVCSSASAGANDLLTVELLVLVRAYWHAPGIYHKKI